MLKTLTGISSNVSQTLSSPWAGWFPRRTRQRSHFFVCFGKSLESAAPKFEVCREARRRRWARQRWGEQLRREQRTCLCSQDKRGEHGEDAGPAREPARGSKAGPPSWGTREPRFPPRQVHTKVKVKIAGLVRHARAHTQKFPRSPFLFERPLGPGCPYPPWGPRC